MTARVFPRKTRATPVDDLVYFDEPEFWMDGITEAHVSVTFTWDMKRAEYLYRAWDKIVPTRMGGPATGMAGEEFEPGQYVRPGYVITSRGCPNRCWFCSVWKREGDIRELRIKDGWNVLDDNLLACSRGHIENVFTMLKQQKMRAEFTGGLEAARLQDWHIDLLVDLKPKQVFFAYDTNNDYEPLIEASNKFKDTDFSRMHRLRCYVLIGYPRDTIEKAEGRLKETMALGFGPMAMLWKNDAGNTDNQWRQFQRLWARPEIIYSKRLPI